MPKTLENTDRLKPRSGLPPEVKLIWGELVGAMSPDHFRESDAPLIENTAKASHWLEGLTLTSPARAR